MTKTKKPAGKMTKAQFGKIDKLWRLLEVGLQDLAAAEKAKKLFMIDMSTWHTPVQDIIEDEVLFNISCVPLRDSIQQCAAKDRRCVVCFAGSVMAGTLGAKSDKNLSPDDWQDNAVSRRLLALDNLRGGQVYGAYQLLTLGAEGWEAARALDCGTADYAEDRAGWWKDMRQLLAKLKKADI